MAQACGISSATDRSKNNQTSYPDLLHTLVWNAIMDNATDVHLHCVDEGVRVIHRVDGVIVPKAVLPLMEGRRLLNQLKSAAGLTVVRSFAPLEGQMDWHDEDTTWEIRVTLTPVRERESAHLRLLSAPRDSWDLCGLGFSTTDRDRIASTVRSLSGLVLVTGPTGSGKTTTMYGLASLTDLRTTTTYSIEDPVEFKLPFAQQIEVDEQHGLTMHEGLRTILRMDPDLILIGEIRDKDSAIVAARAALSGRLVLATIHARDAAGAVDALHYLGVPHHIIGSSLRLVIAQNLLRQVCGQCAQPRELDENETDVFARLGMNAPKELLHPGSCAECGWYGYKGRTGIFEVAPIDDEVGALISAGARHRELVERLRVKGIRSMTQDGLAKVAAGITTMEEIFRINAYARSEEPTGQKDNAEPVEASVG
ncbi:MAG: ATPase, T2SS/T4P/T4SS family [Sedimentisphaerales bacterium]|jgi:type II secretory ATPase GspE/PulE/Tfp pilus assembly ATPase PilB-like protein|nr:ATPase, T2SS/T4P/T4SS family [Sedimentisphaerales bacterium]NLZ07446.1 Flp pilus assembly complex ATPase component TadA [Phycisphaerae bacterium]HNY80624.1 ATPase, T2SS/T4P/T4SS family [Sedimentisphaerales bacterium]HOC62956.1 ATPase, T2SS/T4P/T4SS family [Sedimentisphaerales bacterium]HOH66364.1 ATPase, T2SS/T4P/T4SS family [Sedimentisphaerales bacterium]